MDRQHISVLPDKKQAFARASYEIGQENKTKTQEYQHRVGNISNAEELFHCYQLTALLVKEGGG